MSTKWHPRCSCCGNTFDRSSHIAKVTPKCFHTFCLECLQTLSAHGPAFKCPTCKELVELVESVECLSNNSYVMLLTETEVEPKVCDAHDRELLSFYCSKCRKAICCECTPGHNELDIQTSPYANDMFKLNAIEKRTEVAKLQELCDEEITGFEREQECLALSQDVVRENIENAFEALIDIIHRRKSEVLKELDAEIKVQNGSIETNVQAVKEMKQQLKIIDDYFSEIGNKDLPIFETGNEEGYIEQVALVEKYKDRAVYKDMKNSVTFDIGDQLSEFSSVVKTIGILKVDAILPATVAVDIKPATTALATSVIVNVKSRGGNGLNGYKISARIVDPSNDVLDVNVTDEGDGTYGVSYIPQISGKHTVGVLLGKNILSNTNEEFTVQSNDPVLKFGKHGSDTGQLNKPISIVTGKDDAIYVADTFNRAVRVFDKDGAYTAQIDSATLCIGINDRHDELICTDREQTIERYTTEGRKINMFKCSQIRKAWGVAINSANQSIVSDIEQHKLFILDKSGNVLKRIGSHGNGPSNFKNPSFICMGEDDDIIVSDRGNNRIQVLDKHGNFKYHFGDDTGGKRQMKSPAGVVYDKAGHIIIGIRDTGNVLIFNYDGTFLASIESFSDKLRMPHGVSILEPGVVLVADSGNNCIKKYTYSV
ncbi:unnamed protein product [Owenia fusiformis]|uniref:Uncharacterized protein n=1 Tax=Owenia fusiformis TaxID=6347 RepID=A0A8J1XSV4_OWEFU|nr:unnamed protein product [Owenia fusiformis]